FWIFVASSDLRVTRLSRNLESSCWMLTVFGGGRVICLKCRLALFLSPVIMLLPVAFPPMLTDRLPSVVDFFAITHRPKRQIFAILYHRGRACTSSKSRRINFQSVPSESGTYDKGQHGNWLSADAAVK